MGSASARDDGGHAEAARVRELRTRIGLSQEQLAARLGVSYVTVNRWENGRSGMSAAVRRRFDHLAEQAGTTERPASGTPPVPLSSFVGREPEIAALTSLLAAGRLATLVGPGGSGKTRLILELLRRWPAPTDGIRVVFVAMDLISDPALVDTRVAGGARHPRPARCACCRRHCQLTREPADPARARRRRACPGRSDRPGRGGAGGRAADPGRRHQPARPGDSGRAGLAGARPHLPAPDAAPQEAVSSDAVRLFAARAAERMPDFGITAELAQPVAELCRRLDGLPLAIELAASWVGTLSVGQILDHRFDLMASAPAGGDRRVRTLRAVAESSHAMLSADERAVLRDLSVFAGWFTLSDAVPVTALPPDRLVHSLRRLVNSSWLVARHDRDQGVFRMLDTLREYAAEQLAAAGDRPLARARHGKHFAALARASEQSLAGADGAGWIVRLERATADLEAALIWARETSEITAGLEASAALWRWWLTTGRVAEGRRWLGVFIARADQASAELSVARAWWAAALLATENGDRRPAIEQAGRALRVFNSLGAIDDAARAATVLGAAHRYLGDHETASRYLEAAVAHRRSATLVWARRSSAASTRLRPSASAVTSAYYQLIPSGTQVSEDGQADVRVSDGVFVLAPSAGDVLRVPFSQIESAGAVAFTVRIALADGTVIELSRLGPMRTQLLTELNDGRADDAAQVAAAVGEA